MRVLIDYRPALRQRSGVGEYMHGLARALAAARPPDTDIVLYASSWKDRVDRRVLPDIEVVDQRVPVRLLNLMWHRLGWPPVEMLTSQQFDVVHSPHPLLLPSTDAAQIVTVHDLDFLVHPERTTAEVRRDYARLATEHANRADHLVVNSAYTAGEVHQRLGVPRHRITVCRPGAPDWPRREVIPRDGHILFVGTLEPRKNIGGLLEAYRRLLARDASTPDLVLAGRQTPAATAWLSELRRPPLAGRARHLGYVPDAERRRLYEQARVLVLPSFEEGFGLPVLEAMTVGVPVVAASRGAIPEVLGDAGLLVEPDDAEALATALARMLQDTRLAELFAARGARRAYQFAWSSAVRALKTAYDEAVAHRRERRLEAQRRR